jgi:riboflavin biosynthesis pyrimidine reductase
MSSWQVPMFRVWPAEQAGQLDEDELERLYGYPDRDWLAVNFVSSADGAVELGGRAPALSNEPDQRVLRLGSDLADALLVGATTAVVEEFRGQHPDELTAQRRRRHGLTPVATTVVVTTGSLPADAQVLTAAPVPTIVVTTERGARLHGEQWRAAGAEVWTCGDTQVDLAAARERLTGRGLRHIDCEGGHRLFGSLLAAGIVDELRLTVSPLLVAGPAQRIASGPLLSPPTELRLDSLIAADNALIARYLL